jgi:hypothetical protein
LELPKLQDFESVNLIDDRLPLKTLRLSDSSRRTCSFRWVRQVTTAIRSNGNTKAVDSPWARTKEDSADSPKPVSSSAKRLTSCRFTNWWNNDDLLWDSVLAKTPSKLNLVEETGVMFYEKADGGAPWRSEQDVSNLLERKMALSFAADGAGFVEVDLEHEPLHEFDE